MGETPQPLTPCLVFVFFFTLSFATRTNGRITCYDDDSLRYPFNDLINFNCSEDYSAQIGEFVVDEVTDANIYVNIPPMCTREFRKIEQLLGDNFAPSIIENTILVQGCNESLYNCSIKSRFLERQSNLSRCNFHSSVGCFDVVRTTTADVMSIADVFSRRCKYWSSSVTSQSIDTTSGVALSFGRIKLDWWLQEGCSNATCSENANCTQVKLPGGGLGHRCTCLDGFRGNAFFIGGCQLGSTNKAIWIGFGLVGIILIAAAGGLLYLTRVLKKTSGDLRHQNIKALIPLKHYSYAQVKRITKSFSEVVGKGGFGIVYRGTLFDGRSVAVKVLKNSKGNGEDFINEVASMSKTSHVNIVDLLGFCFEGSKRAILYEFLENGSLDRFISRKTSMHLDGTTLYNIALGVARGIEYLHHGCKARIVHFDIKPHNVLLDDNLCPKVSDFGLAKLCVKKESILSLLDTRGTIGYIAPEMFSRMYGGVSHKSDVYSYGMLVLEMIGARNKESFDQSSASKASSMYFPEWIYKDLEKGDNGKLTENKTSNENDEIVRKLTLVGLWCIQSSPSHRPPMNRVVEMMEGSLEALEVPPRPVLQQIPAMPLSESFWVSEESSSTSEVLINSTN